MKSVTGKHTENKTVFLLVSAAAYALAAALYFLQKAYLTQAVVFAVFLASAGLYFYFTDKNNKIKVLQGNIFKKGELKALLLFSLALVFLYMFDYNSWKYSYIGDEYHFFKMASGILEGKKEINIFSENGVYETPLLTSIYQAAVMLFTGGGFFGWKLSSAIVVPLAVIPFYAWHKMVFNRNVAMIAVAALAFSKTMLAFGHIGYNNIQPVLIYAMVLFALENALRKNSLFWSFATGMILGLGAYNYHTSRLFVILAAAYWFFHPLRKSFSLKNAIIGAGTYAAIILFLVVSPDFYSIMLERTSAAARLKFDPGEKVGMIIKNFLSGFAMFAYSPGQKHFIIGGLANPVAAFGMFAGFVWAALNIRRNWWAGVFLVTYPIFVFFIAAIVPYKAPAYTRMQSVVPLLATMCAFGLNFLLSGVKNSAARKNLSVTAACVICAAGALSFYCVMPSKFNFNPESYVIKFMRENKNTGKVYFLGGRRKTIEKTGLDRLYGFEGRLKRVYKPWVPMYLNDDRMKGHKVLVHRGMLKDREKVKGAAAAAMPDSGEREKKIYVYDFTKNREHYEKFKQKMLNRPGL